jgi:N6-L-threonylcarbamoyladenine synthase
MLNSKDLDFSFSGLKTAVLYTVRGQKRLSDKMKAEIANEFENAAVEVLVSKTLRAAEMHDAHMIVVGGGVSANDRLRKKLTSTVKEKLPHTTLHIPRAVLSTDNAIMIAAAAYFRTNAKGGQNTTIRTATNMEALRAEGTMRIANN